MNYPIHLGVTEAGEGEDGIIKSAAGIGALLADGIGDTIRVSLTGDPEQEIPVAHALVNYFSVRYSPQNTANIEGLPHLTLDYQKAKTEVVENIGGRNTPIVLADWPGEDQMKNQVLVPDYFYFYDQGQELTLPNTYKYLTSMKRWFVSYKTETNYFPVYTDAEFAFYGEKSEQLNFVILSAQDLRPNLVEMLKNARKTVIIIETFHKNGLAEQRFLLEKLKEWGISLPVIINRNYSEDDLCNFQVKSASDAGSLFIDGSGDGIWLRNAGSIGYSNIVSAAFGILQASRVRTSKTEYISCPSCGRTLFDLTSTIAKIREKTSHLKHLKIGIMGCIVNGPGEMADADYGYVGAGPGKITLYKSKEVIKKGLSEDEAVNELIALIKENGDWREPAGKDI